jgi:2,5-diamino-6-(ribosylamino)-4(3H)-pyrimidinone 5'-phosphate reductase
MENRPVTTLFLLMSLDGKINSGAGDDLDVDRDFPTINGVREGLHQYYEIEATGDMYSLNTGRVMAKIGVNEKPEPPTKMGVRFIILDRKPHLTKAGVYYLCHWVDRLILVTDNPHHPAFQMQSQLGNLDILFYKDGIDLDRMMSDLKKDHAVDRITIQSGGTLNREFLKADLIDYVNIVVAPVLVGGKDTNTLVDGTSITRVEELNQLRALKLLECNRLEESYVQLKYEVIHAGE